MIAQTVQQWASSGACLSAVPMVSVAGLTTPTAPELLVSTSPASGRRPPELDDERWLRAQYLRDGDMAIALDLHVSRKAVRLARERLGIPSLPPGRRRGQSAQNATIPGRLRPVSPAEVRISARIRAESRPGGPPPTLTHVGVCARAVSQAHRAGDVLALVDALEALGAAAGLALDHLQRLHAV